MPKPSPTTPPRPVRIRHSRRALIRRSVTATLVAATVLGLLAVLAGWPTGTVADASPAAAAASATSTAAPAIAAPRWASLVAGDNLTCGIRLDGTGQCWGEDARGQADVPAGTWRQLAPGRSHTCGLRDDGTGTCWGNAASAALDIPSGQWVQLAVGTNFSCGLRPDATATCWGFNVNGQTEIPPGRWTQLSAGADFGCGIHLDGTAECWGWNRTGETHPPAGTWTQVATGWAHACGLHPDGTAECWGYPDVSNPSVVPAGPFESLSANGTMACGVRPDGTGTCWGMIAAPPPGPWRSFATGERHACGLHLDGTAECWGLAVAGQTVVPGQPWTSLSTSAGHTCGIRAGEVTCWGRDPEATPPPGPFTSVAAMWLSACAIRPDGTGVCWGDDSAGQTDIPPGPWTRIDSASSTACGVRIDGSAACWGADPAVTAVPAGRWRTISTTDGYACGVRQDQTLACWGATPVAVPTGPWLDIATAPAHVCALHLDRTVACWGFYVPGQSSPPPGTFLELGLTDTGSCGVRTDHALVCWPPTAFPPPTGTLLGTIDADHRETCATTTTGEAWCWTGNIYDNVTLAHLPLPAPEGVPRPSGSRFTGVAPVRLLDSREPGTGGEGPVGPGGVVTIPAAGNDGIPIDATAVVLTVTVTAGTAPTAVTAGPAGQPPPAAPALLVDAGQTLANQVTVPLGGSGGIAIANATGQVHVVADLTGFYLPDTGATSGAGFTAATPTRVLDTRTGTGLAPGAPATKLGPGATLDLPLAGVGDVPADATAAVLTVTATGGTAATYVQAYPAGADRSLTAALVVAPGQSLAGLVTVGLGSGGALTLANQQGEVDLVADLVGWYGPGGSAFHPVSPTRVLDTRTVGPIGGTPPGPNEARTVAVAGVGAEPLVPIGSVAVVGNLTATEATAATYVTAFPTPSPIPAPTTTLLADAGQTIPVAFTSALSPTGDLDLYNQRGTVQLVVDLTGWFGP